MVACLSSSHNDSRLSSIKTVSVPDASVNHNAPKKDASANTQTSHPNIKRQLDTSFDIFDSTSIFLCHQWSDKYELGTSKSNDVIIAIIPNQESCSGVWYSNERKYIPIMMW